MSEPLVKNAADDAENKEAKKREKLNEDQQSNDLRFLLSHLQGRRFFWRLMDRFGLHKHCYHQSGSMQSLLIGQQQDAHYILKQIKSADPNSYLAMFKEEMEGKYNGY